MDKITPCLWCNNNAEEMARFYTELIPDSRINQRVLSPADNPSVKEGEVLTVEFTLAGKAYTALNGGDYFKFNEAISLQLLCDDQAEVDRYWQALSAVPEAEQCGWAKDRFGVSWQIVPKRLIELIASPDRARAKRVLEVMLEMKKLDIAALEAA
ncbi:VOC family protein [Devosia sp. 2618]|uniref:VOC family protein n=1 Tax=Devosia sp. 2618 TaxID=3156454 RepID=UPI003391B111